MNSSQDPWKRLVEAAKHSSEEAHVSPSRLSVPNLRATVHKLSLTLTWRKWSLLAALGAALIFSAVYFSHQNQDTDAPPAIKFDPPTHIDLP